MPVPGQPRNPEGELPLRFRRDYHDPVVEPGRSPATMERDRRDMVQAHGQVRHNWRQLIDYISGTMPISWTANSDGKGLSFGVALTRALRYMTRSFYIQGGTDNTRFSELHSVVAPQVRHMRVTVGAGQQRGRPVVRNRLSSFGSRIRPLNAHDPQHPYHHGHPDPKQPPSRRGK